MAIQGAEPLQYNGYKVPLMRNLVKRAIRGAAGGGNVGLIEWATSPWGQEVPIHIALVPDSGCPPSRAGVPDRARDLT